MKLADLVKGLPGHVATGAILDVLLVGDRGYTQGTVTTERDE